MVRYAYYVLFITYMFQPGTFTKILIKYNKLPII